MKARYLTFFSYLGHNFRSSEKLWLKDGSTLPDPESVQGLMEIGLQKLRSLNYPKVTLSSRTDGGVHAIQNAAHFDLERFGPDIFNPDYITHSLNRFFSKNNYSICVRQCLRVCDDFSARFQAQSRNYLYRLAVLKPDIPIPETFTIHTYTPIEEWRRCHFMFCRDTVLDIEHMREAASLLVGYHDFSTFKKHDKLNTHKHNRRELLSLELVPGVPLALTPPVTPALGVTPVSLTPPLAPTPADRFDYWDFRVRGRAFVHNQIRRMVGALLAVGGGRLAAADVRVMLQVPSKHSWPSRASSLPPHGLYLCGVNYDPAHLVYRPGGLRGDGAPPPSGTDQ